MMALQMKNGDGAAYYQSAQYCRNYTSPPVSYNDSSHYLARLPGPEAMLKPTFSLFSHPQQPFQHMDSLHQLGHLSMAPTQPPLGPPAMAPAQTIGPPTLATTQSLGPPHIPASHTLGHPTINPAPSLGPRAINPAHCVGPPPINPAHCVGPPPISPAHNLGPPNMNPAHSLGPPTINPAHSLGPPTINTAHSLGPPTINTAHSLGPPPMAPAQPLGPPPMGHTLGPPPLDPTQALGRPPMDLAQPLGPPPPLNPTQALGPPAVLAPVPGRFSHPPSPLSSPPPPTPDLSQLPPRPPIPASIQALISGPMPGPLAGPLPAQAAPSSEQPQDEGSNLGMEEQEGSLGLEELCKPLYCKLCNVTLNSAQQAQAHYQGKNHSKKLRNFYAGSQQPPAIRIPEVLETVSQTALSAGPNDGDTSRLVRPELRAVVESAHYKGAARVILATENDYCKLCDASFSSPAVAQAHYQGKNHAKRLRLAEAQHNTNNTEGSETNQRRSRKDGNEYRLVKNRRSPQVPVAMPGPYYNPRPRQRIPRDLAMCVTPSGQFYCSMCNCGAEQETDFRLHLESKQHKAKVSELRYRSEMENLGYS